MRRGMKYLTFLDYPTLEATGKNIEAQLKGVVEQKDAEIAELKAKIQTVTLEADQVKQRDISNADRMSKLEEQIKSLAEKLIRLENPRYDMK
jgi:chromosome segregation ATPase